MSIESVESVDEMDDFDVIVCDHPVFEEGSCIECGTADDGSVPTTAINYVGKDTRLSHQEMSRVRDRHSRHLLTRKRLHLLLDLDHTLLHTKRTRLVDLEEIDYLGDHDYRDAHYCEFKSAKDPSLSDDTVTKLRPNWENFLQELSTMFDLSVYTMGNRLYAEKMSDLIDPERNYFEFVISKEDNTVRGRKGLDVVMLHERHVLVVDDTESVWENYPRNLIKIKPYNFFKVASGMIQSCMDVGEDESEENGEFSRVLGLLKKVHAAFFDCSEGDLANRDVRDVLEEVQRRQQQQQQLSSFMGNNLRFCSVFANTADQQLFTNSLVPVH